MSLGPSFLSERRVKITLSKTWNKYINSVEANQSINIFLGIQTIKLAANNKSPLLMG